MLGPKYDYSAELPTPGDIGVHFGDGSWGGITGAMAGADYYSDVIGYGETTGFARGHGLTQTPLGLKYFMKTGVSCSNGQDMWQYINTVPMGIPGRLGREIEGTLGVHLRGLAPGMFQDAGKALDPSPMFNTMMGTGYARCRKVSLPVGDPNGKIRSQVTGEWWIDPSKEQVTYEGGQPHVAHWIFDSWISADQYDNTKKVEGFVSPKEKQSQLLAGLLFAGLFVGLVVMATGRRS